MSHAITNRCIRCNDCLPQCPTGAIKVEGEDYWIDPGLCDDCREHPEPQCLTLCPVGSPVPLQAKKGRCKVVHRPLTTPYLFADGKSNPFASAIVIWELCNILTQRQSLPWESDAAGQLQYHRIVNHGLGAITFHITDSATSLAKLDRVAGLDALAAFDIRAASLHLICAAYVTMLECPWEQEFILDDRQLELYLGLDKRKDLSKFAKLSLMREWINQICRVTAEIHWSQQGRVKGFSLASDRLWHLVKVEHHFQEDELGCKHLTGLTFRMRAGGWAEYFLNQQACKQRTAFYQYGILPKSLLAAVMSSWQQHEGAIRMMLWLLFKTKMGREQRLTVPTLMRVAYGDDKLQHASTKTEERKRLLRTFENDLAVLHQYGLKPRFDPVTYPTEIQPLWVKLAEVPDDAEAALEFWMQDGSSDNRLTDAAPRGKWNRLMNARILSFELPMDWQQRSQKSDKASRSSQRRMRQKPASTLSAQQILEARRRLQISQRELAKLTGKSQSWIRDVENGRFQVKWEDQLKLRKVLDMGDGG